jgi:hypothetical protein
MVRWRDGAMVWLRWLCDCGGQTNPKVRDQVHIHHAFWGFQLKFKQSCQLMPEKSLNSQKTEHCGQRSNRIVRRRASESLLTMLASAAIACLRTSGV